MVILLIMLVILGVICWALCKLISASVGVLFVVAAMAFIIKMAKEIFK